MEGPHLYLSGDASARHAEPLAMYNYTITVAMKEQLYIPNYRFTHIFISTYWLGGSESAEQREEILHTPIAV